MAGWGDFFGGLMNKLPILTPSQRRRLNIEKLEKEIKEIQAQPWTAERAATVISKQLYLARLYQECKAIQ